jgi:lysophosphatidate acyltransferase
VQAQVPIVPVVVSSYTNFLDKKQRVFDSSEIIIEALPEISTKGLSHDDINQLMLKIRHLMIEKFNENTREVQLKDSRKLKKKSFNGVQTALAATH